MMDANSTQKKEASNNIKDLIHAISILFVPTLPIFIGIFRGESLSSLSDIIFPIIFFTGYITLLYKLAGGFDWRNKKRSLWQNVAFWLVGYLFLSLILYGLWYLIRLFIAKLFKIPFSDLKGKLLTNEEISIKATQPLRDLRKSGETQGDYPVSICWYCSKRPANPQSVITEKKLARSSFSISNWRMKTQNIYNVAHIPRCSECEDFHQRVAKAGIPSFFHGLQEGNDSQYARPMFMMWWYGCNIFFASLALGSIFSDTGFLVGLLFLSSLTLACRLFVIKADSKDAVRSRLASGLLNAIFFTIYLFALNGSRLIFGFIIILYVMQEIFRGIQINRVRIQELKNSGILPQPFYHRDKHPSYIALQATQFKQD